MGGSGTNVQVYIQKTKTDIYYIEGVQFSGIDASVPLNTSDTNSQTIPAYIPGLQFLAQPSDQQTIIRYANYRDMIDGGQGGAGNSFLINGSAHINAINYEVNVGFYGCNADEFWVPIVAYGISDEYENEKAKFIVQSADAYTSGNTYYYRIAAGNI